MRQVTCPPKTDPVFEGLLKMNGIQLFLQIFRKEILSWIDRKETWTREEVRIEILEALANTSAKYADLISLPVKERPKITVQDEPVSALEEAEREKILQVLKSTMWNQSQTARILGIDRKTVRSKIQRYGLHFDV
jgi:transcriptional regulator with GAF, ATPase, and Fis domain